MVDRAARRMRRRSGERRRHRPEAAIAMGEGLESRGFCEGMEGQAGEIEDKRTQWEVKPAVAVLPLQDTACYIPLAFPRPHRRLTSQH